MLTGPNHTRSTDRIAEAAKDLKEDIIGNLQSNEQMQVSVQAALVEALIGACWTDLGHERTQVGVLEAFAGVIDNATLGRRDAKTALQELAARDRLTVRYELVERDGPPHARVFTTRVLVGGEEAGRGSGSSKQASARAAPT